MNTVAVLSGKGGTGKSIIAASFGYILAHCGFKTALIDCDLFTGGLTFFTLADHPKKAKFGLQDFFTSDDPNSELKLVEQTAILDRFCDGNLFLSPAISRKARPRADLHISSTFNDVVKFSRMLRQYVQHLRDAGFDYVILDTRGGSDVTSIGAAIAAGAFMLVTEADKTSWDVGRVLLNALDDVRIPEEEQPTRVGFVLNKNVLPSEAIEAFLRKEWECAHLATVPLDEHAIRFYQEDKVPVAGDIGAPFSAALIPAIRKIFYTAEWPDRSVHLLTALETQARLDSRRRTESEEANQSAQRFNLWMRFYGTFVATALLAYASYTSLRFERTDLTAQASVTTAAVLIFVMTASDSEFIRRLFGLKRPRYSTRKRDVDVNTKGARAVRL